MSFVESLKKRWRENPIREIRNIVLIVTAVVGCAYYFGLIGKDKPKLLAIVNCGSWRIPLCIEKKLKRSSSPLKHVDSNDPNELLNARSMYQIVVRNRKGPQAKGVWVGIPDAYYMQVVKADGQNDYWRLPGDENFLRPLGQIISGHDIKVNAWTTSEPARQHTVEIAVTHEDGNPVSYYFKTPVGSLAECVNHHPIWIFLIACVLSGLIWLLHRFRFCRENPSSPQQQNSIKPTIT